MKDKFVFFEVIKGGHRYFFKYLPGDEKNLFFTLIQYGKDDNYNISLIEALHLIRKISARVREKKGNENYTFHITTKNGD